MGEEIATAKITSTLPFTANDFMIGWWFSARFKSQARERKMAFPHPSVGEFQVYSGVLAGGTDQRGGSGGGLDWTLNKWLPEKKKKKKKKKKPPPVVGNFSVTDTITGVTTQEAGQAYTGRSPI